MPSSISFVIPCLNEQVTLPRVLAKINRLRETELEGRDTEIVVSDNGSTDDSVRIAESHGARVVHCEQRGYGAALSHGIRQARHEIVIFADADDTYDFLESPLLIEELERGHDLVFGSRLEGRIHSGAMPFLHRYVGTPTLNLFINLIHGRRGSRITDCNSGFRCFRREAFLSWQVESSGMEFASEMIIKAMKSGACISRVPVSLHPGSADRAPHLHTWRDGMRHLLQVFLEAPHFFHTAGLAILLASWVLLVVSLFTGPYDLGFASVFGLHTMMFALLGSLFGLTVWSTGLLLSVRSRSPLGTYRVLLNVGEGALFWGAVAFLTISLAAFVGILVRWASNDFRFLALERQTMALAAFGANGILLVFDVIAARLVRQMTLQAVGAPHRSENRPANGNPENPGRR